MLVIWHLFYLLACLHYRLVTWIYSRFWSCVSDYCYSEDDDEGSHCLVPTMLSLTSCDSVDRQGIVLRARGQRWSVWWGRWRRIHTITKVWASTRWRDTCLCRRSVCIELKLTLWGVSQCWNEYMHVKGRLFGSRTHMHPHSIDKL